MNINLLDRNNNAAILLAGILAIVVGVGVARFAFTSLLPSMLDGFLSITDAGVLASFNFVGYLLGAIFSIFMKDINTKVKYFRIGLILSVITTLILATTTNETLWLLSRIVAGFGSAMLLIVGGALVMVKLNYEDKTKAMGIHFSGIGIAIVTSELISQYVLKNGTFSDAWFVLSIFAFVISFYSMYILSFDKVLKQEAVKYKLSMSIFSPYVILLILAYFAEGVGFVVQGTFLPDIINSLEGLEGYGSLGWLVVGIAGIPSSIIWTRLAHNYGSVNIIIVAMALQVVGILIPAFTTNIYINLLSGALYGSTFIGLVALFMHLGGKLAGKNPVVLMGAMTAAYGIGQVSAPLYSVALIERFGNYNSTLYVTASIVFVGILFLLYAKRISIKTI
ncbi:transporter, major facilitator superfamily MFS_1 [Sulfurimonas gotlandica GD1]|uniref:Transporter, major facilitator superfamily MFS_1 n=1 Tax=Sulfurimonas gotlandica (strain DSM 19862 / JCM 16533 / GD1) TaxID=929558 RepID=B6BLU3_SULGG|nr:YbfB/YjiJ family MFS transporter [Sulfurimonas gotlandica]EDZ61848.1 major facilitator superfamily protein [Sulfurimonas gotlandica GD1]EHP29485.1 transporter, major facilitator superfamily MFS_1 [Sulfurimonas gotlandica GD1]